jgi:glycosyltransferase involved in cell wall biosynthesis
MIYAAYSVIIAVHNAEGFIARAIFAAQNLKPAPNEIILVDDGSTDETVQIIEGFLNDYSNLLLLRHAVNLGPSAARNTGIGVAQNEICIIMDSDDESSIDRASEHLRMHNLGADISFVSSRKMYRSGHSFSAQNHDISCEKFPMKTLLGSLLGFPVLYEQRVFLVPSCTMSIKKSLFDAIGGFDVNLKRNEDADLALRAAMSDAVFSFSSKDCVLRHDSISPLKGGYIDIINERALLVKYRHLLGKNDLQSIEIKLDFRELYFKPSFKTMRRIFHRSALWFLVRNLPILFRRVIHDSKKGY